MNSVELDIQWVVQCFKEENKPEKKWQYFQQVWEYCKTEIRNICNYYKHRFNSRDIEDIEADVRVIMFDELHDYNPQKSELKKYLKYNVGVKLQYHSRKWNLEKQTGEDGDEKNVEVMQTSTLRRLLYIIKNDVSFECQKVIDEILDSKNDKIFKHLFVNKMKLRRWEQEDRDRVRKVVAEIEDALLMKNIDLEEVA